MGIKFTIRNSSIEQQNGDYELLNDLGLYRKAPDVLPCKASLMHLLDWIISSDSGAVITVEQNIFISENRRADILRAMNINELLL